MVRDDRDDRDGGIADDAETDLRSSRAEPAADGATAEEIRDQLARDFEDGEILLADGFDEALIGVVEGWWAGNIHGQVALYDYARCVEILIGEGLTEEDAVEHMSFNVTGAYVGEGTPAFAILHRAALITPLDG
jgi:hypothetical protein